MLLLDTDVMIDIERRHPPALAWLALPTTLQLAIPGLVALELMRGARSDPDARRTLAFVQKFRIMWPRHRDQARALPSMVHTRRSGTGVIDMLIAQTAIGLDAPLASFNTRHFAAVPGLQVIRPYER